MLYEFLANRGAWFDRPAIWRGGVATTYGRLAGQARELVQLLARFAGRAVGLSADPGPWWLAAAAALDELGCRTFLIPAAMSSPADIARLAEAHHLAAVLHEPSPSDFGFRISDFGLEGGKPEAARPDSSSEVLPNLKSEIRLSNPKSEIRNPNSEIAGVVLFTSGTAGQPKAALHTWPSLASGVKRSEKLLGARILLVYDPARYAGLQVLLTGLLNGGSLCIPDGRTVPDAVRAAIRYGVEFVSATPTFWRMLLANSTAEDRRQMVLRQITLGGEPINQAILDALRAAFPSARITHIYASTEMGVCFSVHDGLAGFPADFLENPGLPVRLKIEDGRLLIRSDRAMAGYLGQTESPAAEASPPPGSRWFDTGDAVELRGGRVLFLGRQSSRINVGGEKVYPEEVESAIRQVDGVADVLVRGLASSIAGQLVQADIVPAGDADHAELRRRVEAHCRQRLAGYKQPRIIRFVRELRRADTLKADRRAER